MTKKFLSMLFYICILILSVVMFPAERVESNQVFSLPESIGVDSSTGMASISIPIQVTPGRAGIQPNVTLLYNSSGGNEMLGVGWRMELGSILRSTKRGIPKYNNSDTFVLLQAGLQQELVDISGNATEFRPKTEGSFSKIKFDGTSWIVIDRQGTKYYFGSAMTSRSADVDNSSRIFQWYLDRVEDLSGNYMTVTYFTEDYRLYPLEIKYTGNINAGLSPYASVKFDYEAKTAPADMSVSYIRGYITRQTQRLKSISVLANNAVVRNYKINYISDTLTGKSLLKNVLMSDKDGISTLPSNTMSYSIPVYKTNPATSFNNLPAIRRNSVRTQLMDMNNDGLPDLVETWGAPGYAQGWQVYPNTSTSGQISFGTSTKLSNLPILAYNSSTNNITSRFVDLNGDGLLDYITFNTANNPCVWLNTGSLSFSEKKTSSVVLESTFPDKLIQLIDMNGDGALDIIEAFPPDRGYRGSYNPPRHYPFKIYMNDGNGLFSAPITAENSPPLSLNDRDIRWGDFNGDGLLDLIYANGTSNKIWFNNGSNGFNPPKSVTNFPSDWSLWQVGIHIVDMNGDGLSDLLVTGSSYYMYLNNGKGDFNPLIPMANAPPEELDNARNLLVDFNSDGLMDVVSSNGSYRVHLNNGKDSFLTPINLVNYPSDNVIENIVVVDINGDGVADIAQGGEFSGNKFWMNTENTRQAKAYSLINVDNSIGGHLEFQYQNIPIKGWGGLQYGAVNIRGLLNTVKTISRRASLAEDSYKVTYNYSNGLWDNKSKEFRGFKTVKIIDPDGNYSITEYAQDDVRKGRPLSQSSYDSAGKLFSKSENIWANQVLYPNVNFTYLKQSDNYIYDGNSSGRRTQTQYFYEENPQYGNLTKTINLGEVNLTTGGDIGSDKRTTQTTYHNNMNIWLLGLPKIITTSDNIGSQFAKTTFYYDYSSDYTALPTKGYLSKKVDWAGDAIGTEHPFTMYTYDTIGNLISTTDKKNSTTSISYDSTYRMFPLETINTLGHKVVNEYYGVNGVGLNSNDGSFGLWGQLKSTTDPNQNKGVSVYDVIGRLIKKISPLDTMALPTLSYEYINGTAQYKMITKQRIRSGESATIDTVQFLDGLGRIMQRKYNSANPGQFIVEGQTEYNSRGLPIKKYLPHLTSTPLNELDMLDTSQPYTLISYDAMGRAIRTTAPDGSYSNGIYDDWNSTSYDANGHMQKSYADAFGRIIKKEEYLGADGRSSFYPAKEFTLYATTLYTYDAKSNLIKVQDAKGNITTIQYDALGRKIQMTDPDMGTWKYGYDVEGNLLWQEDAKGQKVNFTYDQINRLKSKSDLSILTVNYTYDDINVTNSKGRLTGVSYGGGSVGFEYDQLGREIVSTKNIGSRTYNVIRQYDALDRLQQLQYPNGSQIAYIYNQSGQVTGIVDSAAVVNGSIIDIALQNQMSNEQQAWFDKALGINPVYAEVFSSPIITTQPIDAVVTASYAATFKVVVSGTLDLTYQWLQQASGENAFTAIDGATSASYTTPKTTLSDHGTKYKCIVANASGSVVSHEATLTVCSWPSVWIKSPLKNSSFMAGEDVTITANASQVNGAIVNVSFYNDSTLLGTSSTTPYNYTITNISPGTYTLTAKAKDFKGTYSKSTPIHITVTAPAVTPSVIEQPVSAVITASQIATFIVAVNSPTPVTYQWMQANSGTNAYTNIVGATNASYTTPIATIANSGTKYKCIVTNAAGSVVSDDATLTVNRESEELFIVSQPVDTVVTASYAATFKVVASGTSDLTYQWLQQASGENAFTAIDGATSASYTTPKTTLSDHGTKYKCIVANASGSVVSHEATLTVCSWPSVWIKSPLKNSSFMAGEDVTITANASQVNGTIVYVSFYNGSTLLGTDSTAPYTYTMSNITPGTYTLTATTKDFKGTYSKSSPVNITVSAPPAPKVNLIANSNKYLAPATITLTATPTQVDAEINRVDFYKDTLLLGSSNSAPYTLSWNNVASGNYSLTAKAFNSYGDHTTSNTVNITVSKPNVYVRNIDYNVYGQILQIQYGNGAVTAYTYDPLNSRLTRIYTSNAQAKVIQDLNYTYDSIGQVLSITDNVNTASQTFQYDALNRLTQATGAAYGTKTYTYDEVGNIITKDGLTYKYGENGAGPHAVTSLSDGTTITYDANGNMSTKSKSGEVMQYYYDAENRLTEVRKNMTLIAEYLYDGDGGRVQKTSYATTVNSVQSGLSYGALLGNVQTTTTPVITKYVGELYEETDNVGTNFIFLGGQRVAAIDTVSGSPVFYHGDHLGSTNVMTDSNGNQTELIEYDPYGKILRHDASAGSSRLAKQQFTGKMLDDETGLIYFGARYYDPSLGRFITPDTIIPETLNPQAFNRYSYANNNPVNFIDNDGHFAWFVAAIIGAVIGGAAGGISAYQSGGSVLAGIAVGALGGAVMGGTGAWIGGLVQAGTIGLGAGSAAMAGIGAATGAASSGILGGNVWQGALLGGLGGGLGFGAGGMLTSNFTKNIFAGGLTASVSTGGIVGGLGSELNGGSFGDGVLSGAIWGAAAFVAGYGAAKGYASYQQSKNQSYSYAFEETFEETSHQILDGPSTIEKVPNPYGRLGGPAHQAKVAEMAARLEAKGWSKIRIEAYLSNKGSTRGSAYVDLVATKNGRTLRVQVGKQTIVRQTPIAREVRNIYKIKGLIGPQEPGKSKIIFIPYNKP